MLVAVKGTDDERVASARPKRVAFRVWRKLARRWASFRGRGWHSDNVVLHSFGNERLGVVEEVNTSGADVVNLHWISGLLSVRDIGKIRKPLVWTLHDMWAFCGAEHYAPDEPTARFRTGYSNDNRLPGERGPDLDRRTWLAKRRAWAKQRFTLVSNSHWTAKCARESRLFVDSRIEVIPYPLDTENVWKPISQLAARAALGIPGTGALVLVGAMGGLKDPRKGGDLFFQAVWEVARRRPDASVGVFGGEQDDGKRSWPLPVHWLGAIRDDRLLALVYSAANVMVVPSRQEAFGQTASEAQACGTPVAGFDIGGIPDIVSHQETGWLARPFDPVDLAEGILWMLENDERQARLRRASRTRAVAEFAEAVVAAKYAALYDQVTG
jgi:glycosyltransferase involved in cell wall biosynthesis